MIGESGVGKSTLVGRLCEDRFMPEHRQYTLGMYNGYRMAWLSNWLQSPAPSMEVQQRNWYIVTAFIVYCSLIMVEAEVVKYPTKALVIVGTVVSL